MAGERTGGPDFEIELNTGIVPAAPPRPETHGPAETYGSAAPVPSHRPVEQPDYAQSQSQPPERMPVADPIYMSSEEDDDR